MNAAIILSGGTGSRMGSDIPKQYIEAGGRPVIAYCISVLESSADIDRIVVVAAEEYRDLIRSRSSDLRIPVRTGSCPYCPE